MIYNFLSDYLSIIIFLFIALFLSIGFILANYLASPSNPDPEKLSAYECGFDAFDDSRMEFDVRFYLVAILFIIFDLEIAFLFPWAISLGSLGALGFWSMMIFLSILTIGFIYEWKKGALEYDKIEVVGSYKHVQVRKATVIKKDGVELTRSFERFVLNPGTLDESNALVDNPLDKEPDGTTAITDEIKAVANAVWTAAVKDAWKAKLIADKSSS